MTCRTRIIRPAPAATPCISLAEKREEAARLSGLVEARAGDKAKARRDLPPGLER